MEIKGAIFDLDGTILDSMHIWTTLSINYLKSKNITPQPDILKRLENLNFIEAVRYIKDSYNINERTNEIYWKLNEILKDFYYNQAVIKEGVTEFLEILKSKQIKMCIATATEKSLAKSALKRNKILKYFDKIFTCAEIGSNKDKPDIYNICADYMQIHKNKICVFEDALYAAQTAKNAGFKICGVYDQWEVKSKELQSLSDVFINSFKGVGEYFD